MSVIRILVVIRIPGCYTLPGCYTHLWLLYASLAVIRLPARYAHPRL